MRTWAYHAGSVFVLLGIAGARAGGVLVPTAESAGWVALEHRDRKAGTADICAAVNAAAGLAFLSDGDRLQIRVLNSTLYLPAGATTTLVFSAADWTQSFDIRDTAAHMVNADVSEAAASALLLKMDRASTMRIVVGSAPAIEVSLAGSTDVTNAFRTCAGLEGNTLDVRNEPFQGSAALWTS